MASCEDCRATFAALEVKDPVSNRATRLDRSQPQCRCQHLSVSEFSSGALEPGEVLLRVLVAPQHMDKKGRPRAAALTDAERNGLSMLRKGQATPEEIVRVAKGLVETARAAQAALGQRAEKAGVFGVLEIPCSTLREFELDEEGATSYCVYDTALDDLRSHAEAFQRVEGVEIDLVDARRKSLFSHVKPTFVPVASFMDGLLQEFAPQI